MILLTTEKKLKKAENLTDMDTFDIDKGKTKENILLLEF